jgi:hypothetical protein
MRDADAEIADHGVVVRGSLVEISDMEALQGCAGRTFDRRSRGLAPGAQAQRRSRDETPMTGWCSRARMP